MPRVKIRPLLLVHALVLVSCASAPTDADPATTTPSTTATTPIPEAVTTTVPEPPEVRYGAALPTARTEVAGTLWEGRIVVVGGLRSIELAEAGVYAYDPVTDEWSALPDLPEPLHHTAVGMLGERLYVVGGYAIEAGSWAARNDVWSLGPGEAVWRAEPPLLTGRGALAVASTGDRLVAIGGVDPTLQPLATTEILEAGAPGWVPGPEMTNPREHLAATAVGGEVYAIAGRVSGNLASVEVMRDGAWRPAPDLNDPRSGIGAAVVHGMPCVTGGEDEFVTIGSVECLVGDGWVVVANLDVPRHGLAVVAVDGLLHVIGGGRRPGLSLSDVHEIIPILAP